MTIKYTVETYYGERCVVGRVRGVICETYACGDLSRKEAIDMARDLAAEQERVELNSELDDY
jgi:hypothetical protein